MIVQLGSVSGMRASGAGRLDMVFGLLLVSGVD